MRDPYTVLGVSRTASQDDIKKAYRKLAKELHPDRHKGDNKTTERFKEVSAAYAIVGDEDNRKKYDRGEMDANGNERPHGFSPGGGFRPGAGAGPGRGPWGGARARPEMFEEFGIGEDLFADLFGGRRGGRAGGTGFRTKGADRNYAIKVDFLDAARGTKRRITLPDGKELDVAIPAGIQEGQQIRLRGQGEAGAGEAGDALIEVGIGAHPFFERRGNDIHVELPITLREAVLGGKINAPTIGGMVTLTVPKGASSGTTLRLKGKGIHPKAAAAAGDQFVKLKIVLPAKPDAALEKLVQGWDDDTDIRSGFAVS
jgi:DnaJ-class molecular chaperone